MIYTQTKRYRLVLWKTLARSGLAVHWDFDSREDAERAFAQSVAEGQFLAGILYEWDKHSQSSSLLSQYPKPE